MLSTQQFDQILPHRNFPVTWLPGSDQAVFGKTYGIDGVFYRISSASAEIAPGRTGTFELAYSSITDQSMLESYRAWLAVVGLLALTLCILSGYLLTRRALRPLKKFIAASQNIGTKKLHLRVPMAGLPPELVLLAVDFNRMLERLEASFERLSRFSSDIAHELRTPVQNQLCMAEVALNAERTPEQYREILASLLEESRRHASLIDSLLFLARAEDPATQVLTSALDLSEVAAVLQKFYQFMAEDRGITLSVTAPEHLMIQGDLSLIHRALGNLLENALEHTPAGGTVSLTLHREDEMAIVTVRDSGCGIAAEHLPKVFDRLYRIEAANGTRNHLGIGLAIVKSIAHLHHGEVGIESEIGRGTSVILRLGI